MPDKKLLIFTQGKEKSNSEIAWQKELKASNPRLTKLIEESSTPDGLTDCRNANAIERKGG